MSASNKKQLRKEQNAADMTEKQLQAQAEAKKLKTYTRIFVAALAIVVIVALGVVCFRGYANSGIAQRNTVAVTIGEHQLTNADLSYYYVDAINKAVNDWRQQYGEYASMLLPMSGGPDLSKPLSESIYNEEDGTTWADFFVDAAIESAKSAYAVADKAAADGFQLPEDQVEAVDSRFEAMRTAAESDPNFGSLNNQLKQLYGPGSSEESFRTYFETNYIAMAYQAQHAEELTVSEEDIRAYDAEHAVDFNSYSYATYFVDCNKFLQGGTVDEDGHVSYSDEEKAASVEAAKKAADELSTSTSVVLLDKAIRQMDINKDAETPAESTKSESVLPSSINSKYRDWVTDAARKEGDIAVFTNELTTTDIEGNETTTVTGYFVVSYQSMTDNTQFKAADVRHILAGFKSEDPNAQEFTEEEKKAALEKAEKVLADWKAGEATEDSFAALVEANTDDKGSIPTGGLFEDVYPSSPYVEPFLDWATAEHEAGDTGIVETQYGYHVMYYVGASEPNFRDFMITNTVKNDRFNAWYHEILDGASVTEGDTSKINRDLMLSGV